MSADKALVNVRRALGQLRAFSQREPVDDLVRAAVIQAFEFTFEAFWKLLQKLGAREGLGLHSPKSALRWAYARGLCAQEETFLNMLSDRNLTVHTYDEKLAQAIYARIVEAYVDALAEAVRRLADSEPADT